MNCDTPFWTWFPDQVNHNRLLIPGMADLISDPRERCLDETPQLWVVREKREKGR